MCDVHVTQVEVDAGEMVGVDIRGAAKIVERNTAGVLDEVVDLGGEGADLGGGARTCASVDGLGTGNPGRGVSNSFCKVVWLKRY